MGTSASNSGPLGTPPLLPDWFTQLTREGEDGGSSTNENNAIDSENRLPDNDQTSSSASPPELTEVNNSKDWRSSKGALTRLSNSRNGSSIQKAGRKYVDSLGGSKGATKAARSGRVTASRYANFLGSVASGGINNALQKLGLDQMIGKSSEEICLAIANSIAPIGATNDQAISREALIATLDTLYTKLEEAGSDFSNLDGLTIDQIKETLIEFVSNYIFIKWTYELGIAIEKGDITELEAINLEIEVKELIYLETFEKYRDVPTADFDINDHSNKIVTDKIFQTAYSTLRK